MGIIFTIGSFALSIPVCKKAMKVADLYAIPFFTGLLSFGFISFICKVLDVSDRSFVREVLEVLGLLIGIYLGNKYKLVTKVLVTSLIGANLSVYGATLALKWQPIIPRQRPGLYVFYIIANIVVFVAAYSYQRY